MSGITDVARLAGVSKATASRALSGRGYVSQETRQRVNDAAKAIGYVPWSNASSLVTGRTRNVGVVIPYINRWFFGEVLEGIESTLVADGYDLTLYQLPPDAEHRRRVFEYFLVRKRVDALVAVGIELTLHEIELLDTLGTPAVGIGGVVDGIPTFSVDDVAAARLATEHLLSLGHERILHLGGNQDAEVDFHVHAQRLAGFRDALADAGLAGQGDHRECLYTIEAGYSAALTLLADPRTRPTGIVAACDEIGIGAILAARQLGIAVPGSLSIVGIDGHDLADMFGLTTIAQHPRRQGAEAARRVLAALEGEAAPGGGWEPFPVELVVRTSTTAPAAQRV